MPDFADLAEGGARLAELVGGISVACDVVVGVHPNGLPAAHAVAQRLNVGVVNAVRIDQEDHFDIDGEVSGHVIVCDDGVETGRAALTLGQQLRQIGVTSVVLAVPVCPREIEPALRQVYDDVLAVVRPLARRSLKWHYARL